MQVYGKDRQPLVSSSVTYLFIYDVREESDCLQLHLCSPVLKTSTQHLQASTALQEDKLVLNVPPQQSTQGKQRSPLYQVWLRAGDEGAKVI